LQVACPHCRQVIEFSGPWPAFCGFCGRSLAAADDRLAETAEHVAIGGPETHEAPTLTGDFPASPAGIAAAPTVSVADYRLLGPLGKRGMGAVWEAEQATSGRRVALKLLSKRLPRTPETIERFLREGQLAASVSHPRSTFVFGAGEHEGQPYIVMELMPGRTLKDLIDEEGAVAIARSVDFILDVIEGLQAAHAIGVVHRDVKPSNCFLDWRHEDQLKGRWAAVTGNVTSLLFGVVGLPIGLALILPAIQALRK
jgi:serine/threonine protein kinase